MRALVTVSLVLTIFIGLVTLLPATERTLTSRNGMWRLSISEDNGVLSIFRTGTAEALRRYKVSDTSGRSGRLTCLVEAPSRQSFFAVLGTVGEIWEMSYDPDADPVFPGFVHNYRIGQVEGIEAEPQPFARRRLHLALDHSTLVFSPDHTEIIGYDRKGGVSVFNLDARRPVSQLALGPDPLVARSRFLERDGETLLAVPDQTESGWRLFSTSSWHAIGKLKELPSGSYADELICSD